MLLDLTVTLCCYFCRICPFVCSVRHVFMYNFDNNSYHSKCVCNFLQMFVITGFMNIINKSMTDHFPRSIAHLSEGAVSVKRIQVCFSEYSMQVAVGVPCFHEISVKSVKT